MKINYSELNSLLSEYNELSNKAKHSKEDERRMAFLQTAIAAVKAGGSIADVHEAQFNERARRHGLPELQRGPLTPEQELQARGFLAATEKRDNTQEGGPMLSHIGSYNGLGGTFVPTGFYPDLFRAMAAHDILFDEDSCTVIKTDNGRPIPVPVVGDIENVATVLDEASERTSSSLSNIGYAEIGAYSYSSPYFPFSMEAAQDLVGAYSIFQLAKTFFADRIARGIGADLMTGNGSSKPFGLLATLSNIGLTPVTASGSAANTGGSETGVNSLGSADFANALENLDSAYLSSTKLAWAMNKKTLGYLNSIVTKYGSTLDLVKYVNGKPYILGVPVKISPSLPNIGPSQTPVLLGDFSYWVTRLVKRENLGIGIKKEAPGLVEYGKVAVFCFVRADGALAYKDTNSPAPFVVIQNHS